MRILMIEPYVDIDGNTGDSTHVNELALTLSAMGVDVTLISRSSENTDFDNEHLDFRNVNVGKHRSVGLDIYRVLSALMAFYVGFIVLLGARFDFIHEREPFPIGLILSKIFRVNNVTEINGFILEELRTPEFNQRVKLGTSIIWSLYSFLERMILLSSDRIIAVSPDLKAAMQRTHRIAESKISVLENGVNVHLFRPVKVAVNSLGLDERYRYICFIGNLHKTRHALDVLIDASPIILESVPDARFMVVGDGVLKEGLVKKVNEMGLADKFHFVGVVPYRNLPIYINTASVCVAPARYSKNLGSPLKVYEYLACAKPVVASEVGIVGRLLRKSDSGIVVPPENSAHFAIAIIKLLKDDKLAARMGESGRQFILNYHSWEAVAAKLVATLSDRS